MYSHLRTNEAHILEILACSLRKANEPPIKIREKKKKEILACGLLKANEPFV